MKLFVCNGFDLGWKGQNGEFGLPRLPVEGVDILGAGVAEQKR